MKRALVYGGKGALGQAVVKHFKGQQYWVASVDLSDGVDADHNIVLNREDDLAKQSEAVLASLTKVLGSERLDCVLTVAGGWAGGNAASGELLANADLMWKQSVWSSLVSAQIAAKFLKEGGLVVLSGAKPSLGGTPGMMGYGMAKAAVHQLTQSLAGANSGLPKEAAALCILPVTLDTPMNRKFMPKADTTKWTPLSFVAETMDAWTTNAASRPKNGGLVQLLTKDGKTELKTE